MEITNFQIVFDHPTCSYFVGENVTGKVKITFSRPRKICSLSLKIKGVSYVHWTTLDEVTRRFAITRRRTRYTAKEEVYQYDETLVNGINEVIDISAGKHDYPFSASLPDDIPSSFEGKYGFIRYVATATLQRPWKFNQEAKAIFNVTSPVDLNKIENVNVPITAEAEKSYHRCCRRSLPVHIVLSLPCRGFVQGQSIPLSILINNQTNLQIYSVIISLRKIITWKAVHPVIKIKEEKIEISRLILEGVSKHHKIFLDQLLPVPYTTPKNLNTCSLIRSKFRVIVTLVMSRFRKDLMIDVPVYFGTIPFQNANQESSVPVHRPSRSSNESVILEHHRKVSSPSFGVPFSLNHDTNLTDESENSPNYKNKFNNQKNSLNPPIPNTPNTKISVPEQPTTAKFTEAFKSSKSDSSANSTELLESQNSKDNIPTPKILANKSKNQEQLDHDLVKSESKIQCNFKIETDSQHKRVIKTGVTFEPQPIQTITYQTSDAFAFPKNSAVTKQEMDETKIKPQTDPAEQETTLNKTFPSDSQMQFSEKLN